MKKVAVFCLFLLSIGCSSEGGDTLSSTISTNSITLFNVSPTNVTEGISTEFSIVVDYELADTEEGEINIGFNIEQSDLFTIVQSVEIQKGKGRITFRISETPIDYSADNANFTVYANISEFPHPPVWTPLDSDFWSIDVARQLGISSSPEPSENDSSDLICYTDFEGQCIQY